MSFKVICLSEGSSKWASGPLVFATKKEAENYGLQIALHWTKIIAVYAIPTDREVNARWKGGQLVSMIPKETTSDLRT